MATTSAPRGQPVATGHSVQSTSQGQMDATNPTHTTATDRASPIEMATTPIFGSTFGVCFANDQTTHPAIC